MTLQSWNSVARIAKILRRARFRSLAQDGSALRSSGEQAKRAEPLKPLLKDAQVHFAFRGVFS